MITLPGQVSHGMPPGDPLTGFARSITDLQRQIDELRSTPQQMVQAVFQNQSVSTSINDTTLRPYAATATITVPVGFDRLSIVSNSLTSTNFTGSASDVAAWTEIHAIVGCPFGSVSGVLSDIGPTGATLLAQVNSSLTYSDSGWSGYAGSTFNIRTQAYFNGATTTGTTFIVTNALILWTRT